MPPSERVIAADLQQQMLDVLQDRAKRAGVADRIRTHRCEPNRIGVDTPIDFAIAFAMVHETPHTEKFLQQIYSCLKVGGLLFVAEPRLHVPVRTFEKMMSIARGLGLTKYGEPQIRLCKAVVLAKP